MFVSPWKRPVSIELRLLFAKLISVKLVKFLNRIESNEDNWLPFSLSPCKLVKSIKMSGCKFFSLLMDKLSCIRFVRPWNNVESRCVSSFDSISIDDNCFWFLKKFELISLRRLNDRLKTLSSIRSLRRESSTDSIWLLNSSRHDRALRLLKVFAPIFLIWLRDKFNLTKFDIPLNKFSSMAINLLPDRSLINFRSLLKKMLCIDEFD